MQEHRVFNLVEGETIAVNKPYRWTSFDVVNKIRLTAKKEMGIPRVRIGHAGTLDPLATGLLILCTGRHTKLIESFQELEKEYSGIIRLGATTPSFDLETPVDRHYPYDHIRLVDVEEAARQLSRRIMQIPPVYSAIKIDGRRAFEYARKDEALKMKARSVLIHSFQINSFEPPDIGFSIVCSKGTYIRSIARDIGVLLNSGAHLTSLHRDRIGNYTSRDAFELDKLLNILSEHGKLSC